MQPDVEGSPRPSARTIGVVYLLYFLTAVFGAFLMKGLVVPTDAVATAQTSSRTSRCTDRGGRSASLPTRCTSR
jgi:hypothetical protein